MERQGAHRREQHSRLCSWLCDAAYPLWSTRGVDPAGGFHERLGAGRQAARRAAPFARQAAPGVLLRDGAVARLARRCGRRWCSTGSTIFLARYRRPDGLFRTLVNADGTPRDERALLYDQAFGLLAFNVAAGRR